MNLILLMNLLKILTFFSFDPTLTLLYPPPPSPFHLPSLTFFFFIFVYFFPSLKMDHRRNLEKNLENVYLSPQSVSSRIKSINEEIKNNINKNREEMKSNKVKDEEEVISQKSFKSQGSISVDRRIGNRIKIDLLEKNIKGREKCEKDCKDGCKEDNKDEKVNDYKDDNYEIKSTDSKVRDLVKNYSMRLNQNEKNGESNVKGEGDVKGEGSVKGIESINNPLRSNTNPFKKTHLKPKDNPFVTNPFNKNNPCVTSPFNTNPLKSKDNPFNKNLYSISNNPLSVLSLNEHSFPSRPFPSLSLTPINVIYAPKNPPTLKKKVDPPSPKKSFNKTLSSSFSFYGPGIEITEDITFSILNTIYKFENGIEDTIYYFKIESQNVNSKEQGNNDKQSMNISPISWIIKKSLSQIRDFISLKKDLDFNFNPYDKKIRDNVILTILNSLKIKNEEEMDGKNTNAKNNMNNNLNMKNNLQFFILTNITKNLDFRSNYLLMSNPPSLNLEPFNFRLVGQALVCYDKTNRVKKIFLLKGCKVEIHSEYSFKISSLENNVILYSSCIKERDSWIKDIEEFIKN